MNIQNQHSQYPPLFIVTINFIIDEIEGGLSDHTHDNGGLTKYGISSAAYPDLDIKTLTREQALELYYRDYWQPNNCNKLPPAIAIWLFDGAIQHRQGVAAKMLQHRLRTTADGIIGPKTISLAYQYTHILTDLLSARAELYTAIVTAKSSQAVFLTGWFNRLFKLHKFIIKGAF